MKNSAIATVYLHKTLMHNTPQIVLITNLSEMQRRVLEYPEFSHMKIDFNTYLQKSVECLLKRLTT